MASAAQSIVNKAVQLLGERPVRVVGSHVAELRDELEAINALLIMQSEAGDSGVDSFVQVSMKLLHEIGYDAEDCVDLYKLRIKCRHGFLRTRLKQLFQKHFSRRRLAREISALHARAIAIGDGQARFRASLSHSPILLPARKQAPEPAPAHANNLQRLVSFEEPADNLNNRQRLVGFEEPADNLVQRLKARADGEDGQLKVFSIVGFGGLGKTTLAMEVCRRLEAEFPLQATVPVSQKFDPSEDMATLLKSVLQEVVIPKAGNEEGIRGEESLAGIDGLDVTSLAEKLKQYLEGKRYVKVKLVNYHRIYSIFKMF
ncbi:hypothetical protein EJB05_02162, partial [Eragrostis curvula]